jgi:transposase
MMGYQPDLQPKLFYHAINLDERIPANHILRKIRELIDFDFIYQEVQDRYGEKGNVSVPPPVILKMMLLLIFFNIRASFYKLCTAPFPSVQRYLYFALRRS